jgi:hypothetical protein
VRGSSRSQLQGQDVALWLAILGQVLMLLTGQWAHAMILGAVNYLIIWRRP